MGVPIVGALPFGVYSRHLILGNSHIGLVLQKGLSEDPGELLRLISLTDPVSSARTVLHHMKNPRPILNTVVPSY